MTHPYAIEFSVPPLKMHDILSLFRKDAQVLRYTFCFNNLNRPLSSNFKLKSKKKKTITLKSYKGVVLCFSHVLTFSTVQKKIRLHEKKSSLPGVFAQTSEVCLND